MATVTEFPNSRTTPGIRTRRALHDSSPRGHNSTENANSGPRDFFSNMSGVAGREPAGAPTSPGAQSNDRMIRSAHPYRGDETMQMIVIAFAIAVASVVMLVWALWPAR